ncbi:unnamed protein product [Pneumocystis jirovecii]|uniref:Armadillo repeat-containing protein 8 n=1 Tax=Pneumocystis jirovecii TaxID=42068 RepID=L0P873_PNEJI|nr:unnamed protein product [Pneumocystis jirovecii]
MKLVVQEQALDVIRNVICGQQENIDLLLNNIGTSQIISIIKGKLASGFTEIITALILKHIGHTSFEVRLGCLWVLINLTWSDDNSDKVMKEHRNQVLKDIGFLEKLKLMQNDSSSDIRERVKTALSQLE